MIDVVPRRRLVMRRVLLVVCASFVSIGLAEVVVRAVFSSEDLDVVWIGNRHSGNGGEFTLDPDLG